MAHTHSMYDDDLFLFEIDPDSRAIVCPHDDPLVVSKGDHNSEQFTFEIPRYIEGHDMMLCDTIQVHYINAASNGTSRKQIGTYLVTDLATIEGEDDVLSFTWTVSTNATGIVGSLNFAIRFLCTAGGKVEYSWATKVYSGISVVDSLDHSGLIVEQYTDILQEWYTELLMSGTMGVNMVEAAAQEYIEEIKKIDVVVEVEQETLDRINTAGATVLNSINENLQTAAEKQEEITQDVLDRIPVYSGDVNELFEYIPVYTGDTEEVV